MVDGDFSRRVEKWWDGVGRLIEWWVGEGGGGGGGAEERKMVKDDRRQRMVLGE